MGTSLRITQDYPQRSRHPVYQPYLLVPKRHESYGYGSPFSEFLTYEQRILYANAKSAVSKQS